MGEFSHLIETDERDFYIPGECPPFFSKVSEFLYFSKNRQLRFFGKILKNAMV